MGRHQPHLLVNLAAGTSEVPIDSNARRHLEKVLRIAEVTPITYTDGKGTFGSGEYENGVVRRGNEVHRARATTISVAAAPPHNTSRLRFLVEKLAELGVARLVWLGTAHGEGRAPRPEKTAGWARSALEQSRGCWLMDIAGRIAVADIANTGTPVFAERGGLPIAKLAGVPNPVLCVGPEGGFTDEEIPPDALRLDLGESVLRVETAAVVGAALFLNAPTGG